MSAKLFMIIAGEASGDILGADLIRAITKKHPEAMFFGVGGKHMQELGCKSLFDMEELSLMGIMEVVPHLRHLFKRKDLLVEQALARRPDVLITIDAPDFCLRVAKEVKEKLHVPCIHYVSPSVWAWRRGRIFKMAKYLDHVLALFPFEPKIYEPSGLSCTFVGHPLAQRLKKYMPEEGSVVKKDAPIAILPGSRKGEIERCLPIMVEAFKRLQKANNRLEAVLPIADQKHMGLIKPYIQDVKGIEVITGEAKYKTLAKCRAAMVASGTANLELAMLKVPMVVCYAMNKLTYAIVMYFANIPYISPVNWVFGSRVVPEYIQKNLNVNNVCNAISKLINNDEEYNRQQGHLSTVRELLMGNKTPAENAAKVILSYLPK